MATFCGLETIAYSALHYATGDYIDLIAMIGSNSYTLSIAQDTFFRSYQFRDTVETLESESNVFFAAP